VTADHIFTKQKERTILSIYTEHYHSVTQNYHPHTIQLNTSDTYCIHIYISLKG